MCRVLIEQGARVDTRDNINRTPLHATAIRGNLHLAKLLMEHGADSSVRDTKYNLTPAEWAEKYERYLDSYLKV